MPDYEFYKEKAMAMQYADEVTERRQTIENRRTMAIVYAIIALAEAIRETKKET